MELLSLPKDAQFPNLCGFCGVNEPTGVRVLSHTTSALIVKFRASVRVPICNECLKKTARRKRFVTVSIATAIVCLLLFFGFSETAGVVGCVGFMLAAGAAASAIAYTALMNTREGISIYEVRPNSILFRVPRTDYATLLRQLNPENK